MGMSDTVHIKCPTCGESTSYQSKWGECSLNNYSIDSAPLEVIADLADESKRGKLFCEHCNKPFIVSVKFITTVRKLDDSDEEIKWRCTDDS